MCIGHEGRTHTEYPMKLNRNGAIVYQGPSMIDGAPIVAIVTGLTRKSKNEKTGNMAQVFILRADMSPLQAIASGADGSSSSVTGGAA